MINNKKKILYVVIMMAIVLLVGVFSIRKNSSKTNSSNTLLPTQIPVPTFTSFYSSSKPTVTINLVDIPTIPTELNFYKVDDPGFTDNEIDDIAKNFGFTQPSFTSDDGGFFGKTLIYSSNTSTLRIVPKERIIDYKKFTTFSRPFTNLPPDQALISRSVSLLLENKLIKSDSEIEPYKVNFVSTSEGGHIDPASAPNVVNVSFQKILSGIPVLAESSETGVYSVGLNSQQEVINIYVDEPPKTTTGSVAKIKSLEDIKATVNQSSTIQSLDNGKIDVAEANRLVIKNISITKLFLAYIPSTNQDFLYPVFVLTGTAFGSSQAVPVTLYLPAIKN